MKKLTALFMAVTGSALIVSTDLVNDPVQWAVKTTTQQEDARQHAAELRKGAEARKHNFPVHPVANDIYGEQVFLEIFADNTTHRTAEDGVVTPVINWPKAEAEYADKISLMGQKFDLIRIGIGLLLAGAGISLASKMRKHPLAADLQKVKEQLDTLEIPQQISPQISPQIPMAEVDLDGAQKLDGRLLAIEEGITALQNREASFPVESVAGVNPDISKVVDEMMALLSSVKDGADEFLSESGDEGVYNAISGNLEDVQNTIQMFFAAGIHEAFMPENLQGLAEDMQSLNAVVRENITELQEYISLNDFDEPLGALNKKIAQLSLMSGQYHTAQAAALSEIPAGETSPLSTMPTPKLGG